MAMRAAGRQRTVLVGAVLGLAALAAVGTTATESLAQEKVLRVGATQMPPTRGNVYGGTGAPSSVLWAATFDWLTTLDDKSVTRPSIAESWTLTESKNWRFKIRPNTTFWNGRPVTAQHVADGLNYLLTEDGRKTNVSGHFRIAGVTGAKVIDPMTVEVNTGEPSPLIPAYMAVLPVIDMQHFNDVGIEGFATQPMASGPFQMDGWTTNGARTKAFKAYWRGAPRIDAIWFTEIPESSSRVNALVSKQIDVDNAAQPDSFAAIKAAGGKIFFGPTARIQGISFVTAPMADNRGDKSQFRDKRLRQAANYAVNKQAMLDSIFEGQGAINSQAGTVNTYGYNPNIKPYPYDPAKARALMAEAGYPSGFDFVLEARTDDPVAKLMYEAMVEDLNKVGMRAKLISIPFAQQLKNFGAGTWDGFGFGIGYNVTPTMDVSATFRLGSCLKTPPVSVYYCDKEETELVLAANREFDPAKRLAILHRLLEVNHDNAPVLMLLEVPSMMSYGPRVRNFTTLNENIDYFAMDIVN